MSEIENPDEMERCRKESTMFFQYWSLYVGFANNYYFSLTNYIHENLLFSYHWMLGVVDPYLEAT